MIEKQSTILVVDDDEGNRETLLGILSRAGYRVLLLESGERVFEIIVREGVQLVLLDRMMPGISGDEVLKTLRAHPLTRLTRVIFCSALGEAEQQLDGLRQGADAYLPKPFKKDHVLRIVEQAFGMLYREELGNLLAFLRGQVHDGNNGLYPILRLLEALQEFELDGDMAELLTFAQAGAARLQEIIGGLLAPETLQPGVLLAKIDLQLDELVRQVCRRLDPLAREKGMPIMCELTAVSITGDEAQLSHIIENLLSNAVKYGDEGSQITVMLTVGGGIRLAVTNNGATIAVEDRERIFLPYQRASSGQATGHGVGLALVRTIAERHGGLITLTSETGITTFTLVLPQEAS